MDVNDGGDFLRNHGSDHGMGCAESLTSAVAPPSRRLSRRRPAPHPTNELRLGHAAVPRGC